VGAKANPTMSSFLEHFRDVLHHRMALMVTYALHKILLSAVTFVLCAADDCDAIELLAREYLPRPRLFLRQILYFADPK
jgi:hypothetical protein